MLTEDPAAPLSVSFGSSPAQSSLTVSGAANGANIARLTEALDLLVEQMDRCISLDLEGLVSMDASALEEFARSAGSLASRGRRLRITSASPAVSEVLERPLLCEVLCSNSECRAAAGCQHCEHAAQTCFFDMFSLPMDISKCREARRRVAKVAEGIGMDAAGADDVALAVGEALANAIQHGRSEDDGDVLTISCMANADQLCISVSDHGPGFDPDGIPTCEESLVLEHGRGILCMRTLMDEVSFHFNGGTTARMVKWLN